MPTTKKNTKADKQSSARTKLTVKARPKKVSKKRSPPDSAEMNFQVIEHQSPLVSLHEHLPTVEAQEMGSPIERQKAQLKVQKELTKKSKRNSTEKNHSLSHVRSHSSHFRG